MSLLPVVFAAGATFTQKRKGAYAEMLEVMKRDWELEVHFVGWDGITTTKELRDRVIAKYRKLRRIHPQVALSGHSGGAFAAVEAAAYLEQNQLADGLITLLLFSLSPWYEPVLSVFLDYYAASDEDIRSGTYDPAALELERSPLPTLAVPTTLLIGEWEKPFMHMQAGAAAACWPNSKLVVITGATHRPGDLGFWLKREYFG